MTNAEYAAFIKNSWADTCEASYSVGLALQHMIPYDNIISSQSWFDCVKGDFLMNVLARNAISVWWQTFTVYKEMTCV